MFGLGPASGFFGKKFDVVVECSLETVGFQSDLLVAVGVKVA